MDIAEERKACQHCEGKGRFVQRYMWYGKSFPVMTRCHHCAGTGRDLNYVYEDDHVQFTEIEESPEGIKMHAVVYIPVVKTTYRGLDLCIDPVRVGRIEQDEEGNIRYTLLSLWSGKNFYVFMSKSVFKTEKAALESLTKASESLMESVEDAINKSEAKGETPSTIVWDSLGGSER